MVWTKHDYESIPGSYVFDGKVAHHAFALNKLLFSFNHAENRLAFERDPAAYADRFGLHEEHKQALVNLDFLKMLQLGANIYYLAKLAVPRGFTIQDAGAAFQGITTEEFQEKLNAQANGLTEKLKGAGYWHG